MNHIILKDQKLLKVSERTFKLYSSKHDKTKYSFTDVNLVTFDQKLDIEAGKEYFIVLLEKEEVIFNFHLTNILDRIDILIEWLEKYRK